MVSPGNPRTSSPCETRAEPKPAEGGKVYHVYPADYKGEKQQPAFTGLMAAYNTGAIAFR